MEWPVILALIFAVIIILFPAMLIWYLNIGGMYAAYRERGKIRIPANVIRAMRIALAIVVPVAIYAVLIWFCYGHFGWQVAVAIAVAFPIVLFVPALIWAAAASGLYQVALYRFRVRRRATITRREAGRMVKEPVVRRVT
jgi:hypothetical protein